MALLEFCGGEKNQSKRFPQGGKEARDIQFFAWPTCLADFVAGLPALDLCQRGHEILVRVRA